MNKLSTYGMLLLGSMILCKYYISSSSPQNMVKNGHANDIQNSSTKKSFFLTWLDNSSKPIQPTTQLLFAQVSHEVDKSELPSKIDVSENVVYAVVHQMNDERIVEELTENQSSASDVAPMEEGSSSVVYPMIITPNERILEKKDRGDYPLDQGNTISNNLDRIFPRSFDE